jgi:hypothetical protein
MILRSSTAEKLGIRGLHLPVGTDLRRAFEGLTVQFDWII